MPQNPQIIESVSLVAPLGLCFHDAATGDRVVDGLRIEVYQDPPRVSPDVRNPRKKRTKAFPNRSGVYVLHKVQGLDNFPFGKGDAEFWLENSVQKSFIAEVIDEQNRFQPFQIPLKLPVKGLYQWESIPVVSPSKDLFSIPLYSSPARVPSAGMSVIRAELRETDEKPASFAVLEARFRGKLIARGLADRDGKIALIFPSLSSQTNPIISPPAQPTRTTLAEQKWDLDLTLKYQPDNFPVAQPDEVSDEESLPDLKIALAQAVGKLWANVQKTEQLTTCVLQFGKELILRSRLADVLSPMPSAETVYSSNVYVTPA